MTNISTQTKEALDKLAVGNHIVHVETHCNNVLSQTKCWLDATKQAYINAAYRYTLKEFSEILCDIEIAYDTLEKYTKMVDNKYPKEL